MLRLKKVATPLTAVTVVGPERVPLAGLVPVATVMLVVAVVTVLPWASWTATCTAGVIAAPAAALLGCTVKATFAAAPTPMSDAPLAEPQKPVPHASSVQPVVGLCMLRFATVLSHLTAATVVYPVSVPVALSISVATVMLVVAVVTVLPWASWIATCTAGVIAAPAAALLGCTVKTTFAAAPTLMLNAVLVAPVRPVADAASV